MRQKLMNFMRGRYGIDQFSDFLMGFGCALVFLTIFINNSLIYILGMASFIYAYVRIFSRNYQKRYAQNQKFLQKTAGIRAFFRKEKSKMNMRKTHRIFRCPECGQNVKVPKGKGKIAVTCPKCRCEFVKRS